MSDELRWVSKGCDFWVKSYDKYDVNGYRFHTESHHNSRPNAMTINTGVFVPGHGGVEYYGRLEKIYELQFLRGAKDLKLVVFKCRWFNPVDGLKHTPSIGLVEVKTSSVYPGADVFIVATQATQVYYLPYPCKKPKLLGWEVVYKVSPHGKLPIPIDEDYNNIDPNTYEGDFYQEQGLDGQLEILLGDLDGPDDGELNDGEVVVNPMDLDLLAKLLLDDDIEDNEPPLASFEDQPFYMRDSDDDTPEQTDPDYDDDYF